MGEQRDNSTEEERREVVEWMLDTGHGPTNAARHFFPGVSAEVIESYARKFSRWKANFKKRGHHRALNGPAPGDGSTVVPARGGSTVPVSAKRHAPRFDLADLPILERLRRQLASLQADLDVVRAAGDLRQVPGLDRRIQEVGKALEEERRRSAEIGAGVERTPQGIAKGIEQRADLLAMLHERRVRRETRERNRFAASSPRSNP